MLNVYLRNPQTDAGAWLNFPASYQTVQHLFSVLGDILPNNPSKPCVQNWHMIFSVRILLIFMRNKIRCAEI